MSIFLPNQAPQAEVQQPTIVAQRDPGAGDMYPIGQFWINQLTDVIFTLTSFVNGAPVWTTSLTGGSGVFTSLTVTPGPTAITGIFHVEADVDQAEVIRLHENGGTSGSIEIASLQGTGADSISILSVEGGIEVSTAAAAGNIVVSANGGGSTSIGATADSANAILINANGGTDTTILVVNNTGTNDAATPSTASITLLSSAGGIGIQAAQDFTVLGVNSSLIEVSTGDLSLLADTGDILAGTTLGDISLLADAGAVLIASTLGNVEITANDDLKLEATTGTISFTSGSGLAYSVTGGISIDATADSHFTVTGAGADLSLISSGGRVIVTSDGTTGSDVIISATGTPGGGVVIAPDATTAAIGIGHVVNTVNRVTDINVGQVATAVSDTLNLGVGATATNAGAAKNVNILTGNNTLGTSTLALATGTTLTGSKIVTIGNVDGLTRINEYGVVGINDTTSIGATTIGNVGAGGAITLASLGTITETSAAASATAVTIKATGAGGGVSIAPDATTAAVAIANVIPTVARTVSVSNGAVGSAVADTLNLGTGATTFLGATKVINIGTGANTNGATSVNIATGTTTTGTKAVVIGNSTDALTAVNAFGVVGINTTGSGASTIGNAAAGGAIALTTNTTVGIDAKTASHFLVTGAADLTLRSTAGSMVIQSGEAVSDSIQLTSARGIAATVSGADFVLTGGNLEVATAASGVILGSGTHMVDGAGSPNASVTAPKGSLYLATNGTGVNDRLYINTDGATAWTAIVTVA